MIKISIQKKQHYKHQSVTSWCKKFINALIELNVRTISELIEDDIIINSQTKWEFLAELRDRMNLLKNNGSERLELKMETCKVCSNGCKVHYFTGKQPYKGIGIRFEYKDDILEDIILCNFSTGDFNEQEHRDFLNIIHQRHTSDKRGI